MDPNETATAAEILDGCAELVPWTPVVSGAHDLYDYSAE